MITTTTTTTSSSPVAPISCSYYHYRRGSSSNLFLTVSHPFISISLSSNCPVGPTHLIAAASSSSTARQQRGKRPQQQQQRNQNRRRPPPPPQKKNTNNNNSRGFGQNSQSGPSNNKSSNNSKKVVAVVEEEEVVEEEIWEEQEEEEWWMEEEEEDESGIRSPPQMPKPPAGFVFDDDGTVVLASKKRIITIVDEANNQPLDCIIRRVFQSSKGDECMLLCPADMPVQILRSKNFTGWAEIDDDEVEGIFPHASYALAKNHMHLVDSGFCYTARGGYCYSDDQILEFCPDEDEAAEGWHSEGVEIASFSVDGSQYMIYTPIEPLLFVAVKDKNGVFRMADDDLLNDPAVVASIDEETEFTALVEEEEALRHSALGER